MPHRVLREQRKCNSRVAVDDTGVRQHAGVDLAPAHGFGRRGPGQTTPDDLIRFARALFTHRILSDAAFDEMTNTSAIPSGTGLGIFDADIDGRTAYGNSGGAPGFHANFMHDPDRGTTVVVFTNCPSCAAGGTDTWQLLVDLLTIADMEQ